MRARRVGNGPEFRLFQNEREIGRINGTSVSFLGFETPDDAALASAVAHRALTRRRRRMPHRKDPPDSFLIMDQGGTPMVVARSGILATLLPPAWGRSEVDGWGFEVQLVPEEQFEVFAVSRARVIWRAVRRVGIHRRMRQFRPDAPPGA